MVQKYSAKDINIKINQKNFVLADVETIEAFQNGEEVRTVDFRNLIVRNMVEPDETPMDADKAVKILRSLSLDEFKLVAEKLMEVGQNTVAPFQNETKSS